MIFSCVIILKCKVKNILNPTNLSLTHVKQELGVPPRQVDLTEILINPLADMIKKLGEGVADAQWSLDAASLERLKSLTKESPELAEIGYTPNWYHMPEVTVEMKVTVYYEEKGPGRKGAGIFIAPFNAKYRGAFNYNFEGTSTLKVNFVTVPPPADKKE